MTKTEALAIIKVMETKMETCSTRQFDLYEEGISCLMTEIQKLEEY